MAANDDDDDDDAFDERGLLRDGKRTRISLMMKDAAAARDAMTRRGFDDRKPGPVYSGDRSAARQAYTDAVRESENAWKMLPEAPTEAADGRRKRKGTTPAIRSAASRRKSTGKKRTAPPSCRPPWMLPKAGAASRQATMPWCAKLATLGAIHRRCPLPPTRHHRRTAMLRPYRASSGTSPKRGRSSGRPTMKWFVNRKMLGGTYEPPVQPQRCVSRLPLHARGRDFSLAKQAMRS